MWGNIANEIFLKEYILVYDMVRKPSLLTSIPITHLYNLKISNNIT